MTKIDDSFPAVNSIGRLIADGPDETTMDKMMLFGQFVGDWKITECKSLDEEGNWHTMEGELHWGWILDGKALQDVWIGVPDMGTTVRFYDPGTDIWHSVWISPNQNIVRVFTGKLVGDEIVLETSESSQKLMKWIFSHIHKDSFRWHAERSIDAGKSWYVTEKMQIVRMK